MRLIDADKLLEGEHFILKCKSEFGITEMDVFRREVIENAPTIYDLSEYIENAPKIYDLSEYSDKLWKLAYERGKKEAIMSSNNNKMIVDYGICIRKYIDEHTFCDSIVITKEAFIEAYNRWIKEAENNES